MEIKYVSYYLEYDMMLQKCFGCYRVATENAKKNKTVIYDIVTNAGTAGLMKS